LGPFLRVILALSKGEICVTRSRSTFRVFCSLHVSGVTLDATAGQTPLQLREQEV
jgi:hypothetical protein